MRRVHTTCCIAGGGPAGMMLGCLLARAGVAVTVLEKHADFLRDFRGDTVHASTLELIRELGWLEEFLALPHSTVREVALQIGADRVTVGDFDHLPVRCKFIALMPQWDFLDFLAGHARRRPGFELRMRTEATGLLRDGGTVAGVTATGPDGDLEIRADLTVACDGRDSRLRRQAGLAVDNLGAPMDVLWFRLSRDAGDPDDMMGHVESGRMMVLLDRDSYWQCAYVIPKGSAGTVRRDGLAAFRRNIGLMAPFLRDRVQQIDDWDKVKLLTVEVDRLRRWHCPGLLCIGDAAHAMSPIGGVGINLAIQDAVAAANILAGPLRSRTAGPAELRQVQRRREFPARLTQRLQIALQNRLIGPALARRGGRPHAPWFLRLLQWPLLRRLPGRLLAVGVRPEHIRSPAA